jgi:hypothetical protein
MDVGQPPRVCVHGSNIGGPGQILDNQPNDLDTTGLVRQVTIWDEPARRAPNHPTPI